MEWVDAAEEYIGKYGWGARGKNIGISRMFGTGDVATLVRNTFVGAYRPRGIISGFLAIIPNGPAVYLPPIAAKVPPQRLRLRLSNEIRSDGAVFSAYFTREPQRRLVIEDVLVWRGISVWDKQPFSSRWNTIMSDFTENHYISDIVIQDFIVELASYIQLKDAHMPDEKHVFELIPETAGNKRFIWMRPRNTPPTKVTEAKIYSVRKEVGMGPDVYAVYCGETKHGLALVRTLTVSKALRTVAGKCGQSANVRVEHNKTFDKYEVLEVL